MNAEHAPPPCTIQCYQADDHVLVKLAGSLVMQNSGEAREKGQALMGSDPRRIDIYLQTVGFIDSAGLGMLVGLHIMARKRKIEFNLLQPTESHRQLFRATRLDSVFQIIERKETEEVIESVGKPESLVTP